METLPVLPSLVVNVHNVLISFKKFISNDDDCGRISHSMPICLRSVSLDHGAPSSKGAFRSHEVLLALSAC